MVHEKESNLSTADREIHLARLLNAPVNLVWQGWTEAEHIKNWWGPNGFSTTISKMDENGEWDLILHGPEGTDYKNKGILKKC